MSHNKQQPKPENPNNQFSNTDPLTHAQRVAIANTMNNNKIKHLLDTAYKTDSIAKNKWRIENREQLRKERKEKLKELMEKEVTMSNNEQSMKLYTTDQVIEVFEKYGNMSAINARNIIDLSESIELPSDEEIEKQAEHEDTYSKKCAFTRGAKWMWRKTFGGNNEQQ